MPKITFQDLYSLAQRCEELVHVSAISWVIWKTWQVTIFLAGDI